MPNIIRVDPRWPGAWEKLSRYIADAMEKGMGQSDVTLENVYESAVAGVVELWGLEADGIIFGAMVTSVHIRPNRRLVEVCFLGADRHTDAMWMQCLDQLKNFARSIGASALFGTGRDGWEKKLNADRSYRLWELDV